jgi:MFS family permease
MSALEAGLTLAPMPLAALVAGPVSGRLTDRVGGKYILLTGLTLYAAGIALLDVVAQVSTGRLSLVLCLALAGAGAGCCFAPLNTMAMSGIPPRLAGAAAGMLNTTQRLGLLIGNAAIGAVLQIGLASALRAEAARYAPELPPALRAVVRDAYGRAAAGGLDLQGAVAPPPGVPPEAASLLRQVAREVFTHAFVDAMHVTLLVPACVLLLAAATCLAIRRTQAGDRPSEAEASDRALARPGAGRIA